ncbi:MAG: hypothetical protein H7A38_05585 [Chlamydiales bacterium]|nr:hypothetical protein [Chlamydiales bacterium]
MEIFRPRPEGDPGVEDGTGWNFDYGANFSHLSNMSTRFNNEDGVEFFEAKRGDRRWLELSQ